MKSSGLLMLLTFAALLPLGLSALGPAPRAAGAAAQASVTVTIVPGAGTITTSAGYSPETVVVVVGVNNTVTWINDDTLPHTVTARDGSFDSGNLNPGQSYNHTFDALGVFDYYCTYHWWMHGTVVVKAASLTLTTSTTSTAGGGTTIPSNASELVKEYLIPTPRALPLGITTTSDGLVWFTENNLGAIGSFNPQNDSWREYRSPSIPANSSFPAIGFQMYAIAPDRQGDVWFTSWEGDQLVEFRPQNMSFKPYVLGPGNFTIRNKEPYGLLVQNGSVWFSEYNGNALGRLDLSNGNITEYHVPCTCVAGPIVGGPNGTIWFTIPESPVGKLGSFDPATGKLEVAGNLTFDNGQDSMDSPTGIAEGPNGTIWVADHALDVVYRLGPLLPASGSAVKAFWNTPLPGAAQRTEPFGIVVAPNGDAWFAEQNANRIGVLRPDGTMTEYIVPTGSSFPSELAIDGQGRVWFTEGTANRLGMIDPSAPLPFNISLPSRHVTLEGGTTYTLNMALDVPPLHALPGNLTIWVNGIPFQDISYSLGRAEQLTQTQFSVPLLLQIKNALPPGTYSATISFAGQSVVQAVTVSLTVTPNAGGPVTAVSVAFLASGAVSVGIAVAMVKGGPGKRAYRKFLTIAVVALLVSGSLYLYSSALAGAPPPSQLTAGGGTTSGTTGSGGQASSGGCSSIFKSPGPHRSQLKETRFGAVTEFALPQPGRAPNAVAVAPDSSVWFGEQNLTGVAHLFPNGTLVEYPWPPNPAYGVGQYTCSFKTAIWGVAFWRGMVWASDDAGNQLVGTNPTTGSTETIVMPVNDSSPYTLTVGPDGSLWVPEVLADSVGRVLSNGTVVQYPLPPAAGGVPADIIFVNDTGYFVTNAVYTFPADRFDFTNASALRLLYYPFGISYGDGDVWVAQHGTSQVVAYDMRDGAWLTYPTSTVNYTSTTLPYFIAVNGSLVWFNEHYGNRMGVINVAQGTMTEYSESDPPVTSPFDILNTQTFALGGGGAWFVSVTGNLVGFVNASYVPGFSVSVAPNATIRVPQGGTTQLTMMVSGSSANPLTFQFSDSESIFSSPNEITMNPSVSGFASLNGSKDVSVTIAVGASLPPGEYTLVFTVTDGLVYQSKFVTLYVTG
ncbi:MAG: cupredoxin domain-containing protein [Thaumarchaeota archaeon]|nr:cupredoxin domain-containing protein [Nitrososphaerota archaeon]